MNDIFSFSVTPFDVVKVRLQMQKRSKIQQPKCFIYCNGLMDHVCKVHGVMCPNHPMSTAACADAACTNGAATASAAVREWYARPGHFNGTADAFVKIARNEGVASLWSGLPPTLWVYHWKMCPSHRCLSGKLWYLQHNCLWHFTLLILLEKVLEKVVVKSLNFILGFLYEPWL